MPKYYLLFLFCMTCSFCSLLNAQSANGTYSSMDPDTSSGQSEIQQRQSDYEQTLVATNPLWVQQRTAYEQTVQNYCATHNSPHVQGVFVIPVVVHVVYNAAVENISDSQIYSQIFVLNQDYSRTNPDTVNTPVPFKAVAASPDIQFCLAHTDTNGFPTSGIERRHTTMSGGYTNNDMKHYSSGGLDAWDPTQYLNIWVCNSLGSWSEFPTSTISNTYGIVVMYSRFGSNYTPFGVFSDLNPAFNRGRTAVHEIGHCFNLYHVSADDLNCSGTDYCSDTPNQAVQIFGSPTFPLYDSCTTSGNGIMFENYMDWTDDSIQNLFTIQQVARMRAVLSISPYDALTSSTACQYPSGINEADLSSLISVFPNPTSGLVTVKIDGQFTGDVRLQVRNVIGQTIVQQNADASTNSVAIDLSDESDGLYFVTVITAEGSVTRKIMLER